MRSFVIIADTSLRDTCVVARATFIVSETKNIRGFLSHRRPKNSVCPLKSKPESAIISLLTGAVMQPLNSSLRHA